MGDPPMIAPKRASRPARCLGSSGSHCKMLPMPLSWNEIKNRAILFARDWSQASRERA